MEPYLTNPGKKLEIVNCYDLWVLRYKIGGAKVFVNNVQWSVNRSCEQIVGGIISLPDLFMFYHEGFIKRDYFVRRLFHMLYYNMTVPLILVFFSCL
jgi:hypothetical protein